MPGDEPALLFNFAASSKPLAYWGHSLRGWLSGISLGNFQAALGLSVPSRSAVLTPPYPGLVTLA